MARQEPLFTAVLSVDRVPLKSDVTVAPLTEAQVKHLRERTLRTIQACGGPARLEISCMSGLASAARLEPLLEIPGVEVEIHFIDQIAREEVREGYKPSPANPPQDAFGINPALRRRCAELTRLLFRGQRLTIVRGKDFLPRAGPILVVASTSSSPCWSMFALWATFENADTARRRLRFTYDKELAEYPGVNAICSSLGGVPASFANVKYLLDQGEAVCMILPPSNLIRESRGSASRFVLSREPARLGLVTGSAIVPAIVRPLDAGKRLGKGTEEMAVLGKEQDHVHPLRSLAGRACSLLFPCRLEISFMPAINPPQGSEEAGGGAVAQMTARLSEALAWPP